MIAIVVPNLSPNLNTNPNLITMHLSRDETTMIGIVITIGLDYMAMFFSINVLEVSSQSPPFPLAPYTALINTHIIKMRERGFFEGLWKKYDKKQVKI